MRISVRDIIKVGKMCGSLGELSVIYLTLSDILKLQALPASFTAKLMKGPSQDTPSRPSADWGPAPRGRLGDAVASSFGRHRPSSSKWFLSALLNADIQGPQGGQFIGEPVVANDPGRYWLYVRYLSLVSQPCRGSFIKKTKQKTKKQKTNNEEARLSNCRI